MKNVVAAVEASSLFRQFSTAHACVEAWPDEGFTEGGWSYAWIVSRFGDGNVRHLAYVRLRDGQFERRRYDSSGDDLWVSVE